MELQQREIELLGREMNILISKATPKPSERKGKFSKAKLKVSYCLD